MNTKITKSSCGLPDLCDLRAEASLPDQFRRYTSCVSGPEEVFIMPRGDKSKYTDKEKRQAEHIERGYEDHGVPEREAERRAWATVNKVHHGGEKPGGGGYGKSEDHSPMRRGGRNSHKKR